MNMLPLVVILKAAPLTPLALGPLRLCGACGGGEGGSRREARGAAGEGGEARGEAGRGVRRLAGGAGERHASRLPPDVLEFGLSLRFSASLRVKQVSLLTLFVNTTVYHKICLLLEDRTQAFIFILNLHQNKNLNI